MMSAMTPDPADWVRLGRCVQQRRAAIGLSQSAAAVSAGISRGVWSGIEKAAGSKPYDTTLAAVERTLRWAAGSCEAILAGHQPVEREDDEEVIYLTNEQKAAALERVAEQRDLETYEAEFLRAIARKLRANPGAAEPGSFRATS